jgi:predicted acyltransferase
MTVTAPPGAAAPAAARAEPPVLNPALSPDQKSGRVLSLDALRGFDMIWILGLEEVVHALATVWPNPVFRFMSWQMDHKQWEGFGFYDLIFPMFVFMVGASAVFSLSRLIETRGRAAAVKRVVVRGAVLYLLGVLYYGGLLKHLGNIRLMGVLQRIAICYLVTGLLFIYLRPKALLIVTVVLLVGYWAWLSFIPVPEVGHVSFAERANWPNYIDKHYLPWRKWDTDYDPEGILSTFPAIASCLLGVFAGLLLRNPTVDPRRKATILFVAGAAGVIAGYLWGLQFPVIKKIWTSTFVLVAGGYSALLLGLFYLVIDVWKVRGWATPFVWVGTNAITLYLVKEVVDFPALATRFVGGADSALRQNVWRGAGELVVYIAGVALILLLARFLYKRQIFLRV